MKRALFLTGTVLAIVAAAACAGSEDNGSTPDPSPDGGRTLVEDAAPTPDAAEAAASDDGGDHDAGPRCSTAGWCATELPDANLTLRDVWPFPGRAFAVATSPTLGVKVLEWNDADAKWSYIDDNTQNEDGRGQYVGAMWARSEDEIYFSVAPRTIFRGRREGQPPGSWSWTHWQLENRVPVYAAPTFQYPDHYRGRPVATTIEYVALGVFGTSTDVYAWFGNALYRLSSDDAGSPAWNVEYVADDLDRADEQLFFLGATSSGPDDLWFSGGRGGGPNDTRRCGIVVHKTAAGYARVADGVGFSAGPFPTFPSPPACTARAGTVLIGGGETWLSDIQADSPNSIVGLKGTNQLARVAVEGGVYSATVSQIPATVATRALLSMWTSPTEPIWLGGASIVASGEGVWEDAGVFTISTISLNGGWLDTDVHQIRGSSNSDRWAVGVRYALHKTTP